jgi:hypothetical protein
LLQAAKLAKAGWTLVDVRLASDFEKMSAEGSINVPMFRCVLLSGTCAAAGTGFNITCVAGNGQQHV